MIIVTVAVYKENDHPYPFVGVFKNGLDNEPEAIAYLKQTDAEKSMAGAINAMLSGCLKGQWYELNFFEGIKVISTKKAKRVFIEPTPYFSFANLISKLEI